MRREFRKSVKLAAWQRCGGYCEQCHLKIIGVPEYDHVLADGLGGEPTLENCQVLCVKCHRIKTATEDIPKIAKADRIRKKSVGLGSRGRPIPGSRRSKWKRTVSGEVVER